MVLEERLALFDYAINNYDDGLLFFYFSSSDLQSHIFWWDSDDKHPIRSEPEAKAQFGHVRRLYQKLDAVIGDLMDRYGGKATIIVMSDHGFANFGRQFNLNSWLRDLGYLGPRECSSIMHDVDWSSTIAYGLGINGLYLNMKGRERDGIVEPGDQREALLAELNDRLEAVTDFNGKRVIRGVYRSDQIYYGQRDGPGARPDRRLRRGYRASWATCLGDLTEEILLDNDSAWSADHCADCARSARRAVLQPPDRRPIAVARRHRPVDPGRVWAAHAAADGREETSFPVENPVRPTGETLVVKVKIESALFDRAKRGARPPATAASRNSSPTASRRRSSGSRSRRTRARSRTSFAAWDISNDIVPRTNRRLAERRGQCPGAVPARPGRLLAGLAFRHGHRGGDGRAVARRLQVHLESARDQSRPQRHQRQPAGPQAVQGQRRRLPQRAQGRVLLGAGRLFVLAQDQGHGQGHDQHRHHGEHEQPARAQQDAPWARSATAALSLKSFRARRWALMSFRTRWIARWSEVYLKTASNSTPVTAAMAVAESHPGTTPTGASRNRPRTFAAALSQAAVCARRRSFDVSQAAELVRDLALVLLDLEPLDLLLDAVGDELLDAAVAGGLRRALRPVEQAGFDLDLDHERFSRWTTGSSSGEDISSRPSAAASAARTRPGSTGRCRRATATGRRSDGCRRARRAPRAQSAQWSALQAESLSSRISSVRSPRHCGPRGAVAAGDSR